MRIHQTSYAKKVLNRFHMDECNAVAVPADPNQVLCANDTENKSSYPYREAIGSLMYLAIATRPDICFAVGSCSRFMERPTQLHVNAVKRILKYVKGTTDFGIVYDTKSDSILRGYSDADFAGDVNDRKSTLGCVFMLGMNVISWCSMKQRSVALSTTESEYVAASEAAKELIWLNRLRSEVAPNSNVVSVLYMDNQGAIRMVKNPEFHKRTKHIDVRYHFIRDEYTNGKFTLEYVPTDEQIADIFTKALSRNKFEFFREKMNISNAH